MKITTNNIYALAAAFLLAACVGMSGPGEREIPLAKLQEKVDARFPLNNRLLDLFDIDVSKPALALQPADRIALSMDVSIAPFLLKRSWTGRLSLSGRLKFDASRVAIMLADLRVDHFEVAGADPQYNRQIARIGGLLADRLFRDVPLYTFRENELAVMGRSLTITGIATKKEAVVVTFGPVN